MLSITSITNWIFKTSNHKTVNKIKITTSICIAHVVSLDVYAEHCFDSFLLSPHFLKALFSSTSTIVYKSENIPNYNNYTDNQFWTLILLFKYSILLLKCWEKIVDYK